MAGEGKRAAFSQKQPRQPAESQAKDGGFYGWSLEPDWRFSIETMITQEWRSRVIKNGQ